MKDKFDITQELKDHEKKYTIILVVLFLFVFGFLGYSLLSIDNKN